MGRSDKPKAPPVDWAALDPEAGATSGSDSNGVGAAVRPAGLTRQAEPAQAPVAPDHLGGSPTAEEPPEVAALDADDRLVDVGTEAPDKQSPAPLNGVANACSWLPQLLGLASGETPFPWQQRLLRQFCEGSIPSALDIPTGLGKTAVIAIWTAARAAGARVPRRLVYVVDRRAVVDQATEEAERIRKVVDATPELKRTLGLDRSLPISTLRGQHLDNREWLEDPSSPAIVVGTVDMVGSRLLFEGYRCSRRMRPYHAALLGADALLVLDEAHLIPAFEALVRAVVQTDSLGPRQGGVVPRCQTMSLSATGRGATNGLFLLGPEDGHHETVRARYDAKKRVHVVPAVEADLLAETLASKAWELTHSGKHASRVIVFVDSRKTAQGVHEGIERLAKGDGAGSSVAIATELFVGGRRVAEREEAAKRLVELGVLAKAKSAPAVPVFVVATSAGEVGVDLDADHAVLDLVEWERVVQRLGRVNRRGKGEADVWVVPTKLDEKTRKALEKHEKVQERLHHSQPETAEERSDDEDDEDADSSDKLPKKLNEEERGRVERWKRREATDRAIRSLPPAEGAYDGSPRALTALRDDQATARFIKEGSTPAPLHPELTRAVVESWSMTSLEEHTGRPSVRPWLRGWVEEEVQTTIVWRTWLPKREDAEAFFEAAPVETAESLETESTTALDWLGKCAKRVARAAESLHAPKADDDQDDQDEADRRPPLAPGDVVMFVLDDSHRAYTLGELCGLERRERDDVFRSIAGETIVVDARLGGLDESGLLDSSRDCASDVSKKRRLSFRVREVEHLEALGDDKGWRLEDTFVSRTNADGEAIAWLVVETDLQQQSTTADGRSTGREQRLDEHQEFAARHARRIGSRVGLPPDYVALLALAAELHDEGKKAERWQRAFRAPEHRRPLGKTTSRPIQTILAGYRHELGSLPYAERDERVSALAPADRDLVLHLIAAHHGFARPLLRTDGCDDGPPSALVERARTIALRFARLEKRWGPWGLAWWETLLRAADQGASRENDERGGERG